MNHWKIAQSIYNKLIAECPAETCKNKFTKTPQTAFSCRCMPEANMGCTNNHGKNDKNSFLLMSQYYTTVCSTKYAKNVRYLNFNSEQERYNAWQSYLTKFARFCIMLDESTKLAPYMNNYTEPWTDKRFKEHFKLTDIEWQLIDTVIKD